MTVKTGELEVVAKVWVEPVWPFREIRALPPTMEEVEVHVGMLPLMVRMVPVEPVAIVASVEVEEFPISRYP